MVHLTYLWFTTAEARASAAEGRLVERAEEIDLLNVFIANTLAQSGAGGGGGRKGAKRRKK